MPNTSDPPDRKGWPLAQRVGHIEPFPVMALLAQARELEAEGRSIIHMEIGEPDFATPQPIRDAGARAIEQGGMFYTLATGMPALRRAIAGFYRTRYGVEVAAERIIVTPGASGALLLAVAALVNPGDEVLLADPGYPANRHRCSASPSMAGAVPAFSMTSGSRLRRIPTTSSLKRMASPCSSMKFPCNSWRAPRSISPTS